MLSRRVPVPSPLYCWTLLRRLLRTVLLLLMRPPNSRSRRSFSDASTPKILWTARRHHQHMDMPAAPQLSNPVTSQPSTVSAAAPSAPAVVMFAPQFHACDSTRIVIGSNGRTRQALLSWTATFGWSQSRVSLEKVHSGMDKQTHVSQARTWVVIGTPTQAKRHESNGSATKVTCDWNRAKIISVNCVIRKVTERHRLYQCQGWWKSLVTNRTYDLHCCAIHVSGRHGSW